MSWRKIPLNLKAVELFLKLWASHSYCANSSTTLRWWHSASLVSIQSAQPAKVHYWLLQITVSKPHSWPECCLSSFADRQMLLMGTAWAEYWHLKGQTLNVVTSSDSRPAWAPLPLWAQISAVMPDRSTCNSQWASSLPNPSLLIPSAVKCTLGISNALWSETVNGLFLFQTCNMHHSKNCKLSQHLS